MPKLSLQTYTKEITPKTMKLQGVLHQQMNQILVDSRSTYNFLDETLATKLDISIDNPRQMDVIVINGQKLRSGDTCGNITCTLQGNQLVADFHLLPLREYDMALGIQ